MTCATGEKIFFFLPIVLIFSCVAYFPANVIECYIIVHSCKMFCQLFEMFIWIFNEITLVNTYFYFNEIASTRVSAPRANIRSAVTKQTKTEPGSQDKGHRMRVAIRYIFPNLQIYISYIHIFSEKLILPTKKIIKMSPKKQNLLLHFPLILLFARINYMICFHFT